MPNFTANAPALTLGVGIGLLSMLLLPSCGTPVRGAPFDPLSPTFPETKGDNLNGRTIEIPRGLDAPYNILLVAFYEKQQADVDTWLGAAREIAADHANVEYYELPTIRGTVQLARWWVDGGMRAGIPAFSARERTVTIYTDTEKFRALAGIDSPDQIWVGLVDRDGRIYFTARGPATAEALQSLRAAVDKTASPEAAKFR